MAGRLEIKGLQKLSVIDYPGRTCAVVFLAGCNFRCPFCQNPGLVLEPEKHKTITEDYFFKFLQGRKKWLDGVCITGGEPTLYPELIGFVRKIKSLGFLVKLDTNGSNPEMVDDLIKEKLLDYISMDIKSSPDGYEKAAGVKVNMKKIKSSVDIIRKSDVDYEFRSTVLPRIHSKEDIIKIGEWLKGSKRFFLQDFRNEKTIDPGFQKEKGFEKKELEELKKILRSCFEEVGIRT